ncbi:hypothetical protein [Paracraurococcus ruber]|uniref:Lipoprotein n=1 Tax=Paracraurococcus ruber TaxID=77675 RepID=A0ABS1D0Q9_9PROT|nr:hypothetical protein [Paracraurococcus ruber]MBK1660294.1 hypothetical protein [Paracraurococcus ruber]TDG29719.1 hypothetical protein E2C05_17015 [Paracraurococcus ruber]
MSRLRSVPLLLALAACASQTPQAFDQRMTGFVGKPEAELVAGLGVPTRSYEADGRRLLQWDFVQPSSAPAVYPSIGLGFGSFGFGRGGGSGVGVGTGLGFGLGGGAAPQGCSVVFETRGGTVQSFNRNGPGCVA